MWRLLFAASLLALPLAFLLSAQWPLRDLLHAYSLQANNNGQIVFALYAAVAITAATRSGSHFSLHHGTASNRPRWHAIATLVCVAPWAAVVLWNAVPAALDSTAAWERFSEGQTPGYFLLRFALVILAALVLGQALTDTLAPRVGATP